MNDTTTALSPMVWPASMTAAVRSQFPIGSERPGFHYLDYAATALKPLSVLNAEALYNRQHTANVHRGGHRWGHEASVLFERARASMALFLGSTPDGIVWTAGCTDGINQIAQSLAEHQRWQAGDEVLVSALEHHANLLPWQAWAHRTGARLRHVPLDGDQHLDDPRRHVTPRTRVVAMPHVSHVFGGCLDVTRWVEAARSVRAFLLIDGAQAVGHLAPHAIQAAVRQADAYVFSGHKMYGPTGVGVLHLNPSWVDVLPPARRGGGTVLHVTWDSATLQTGPARWEAGTPPIAQALGLAQASAWLNDLGGETTAGEGLARLAEQGQAQAQWLAQRLSELPGVRVLGPADETRHGLVSWTVDGAHAHDVGTWLDRAGVAVRVGHHCAMPLMQRLGLNACLRASVGATTGMDDLDALMQAMSDFTERWSAS